MYNWESCTLNGTEIVSLRINGNLVWEKQKTDIPSIYFVSAPGDPDEAIALLNNLSADQLTEITTPDSFEVPSGLPVFLLKDDVTSIAWQSYEKAVQTWSKPNYLKKGVRSIDEEGNLLDGVYDVEPTVTINGTRYTIWVDDENWVTGAGEFKLSIV